MSDLFPKMFWNVVADQKIAFRTAINAQGRSISYKDLGELVSDRANEFLELQSKRPGRVALLQERSIELCVDIIAGMCSGVSVSLLANSDSIDLNRNKLRSIDASHLIVDSANEASAYQIANGLSIDLDTRAKNSVCGTPYHPPTCPDASKEALVLFTSGSTSAPKGVALSHANIANNTHSLTAVIPVTSDDHLLVVMPIHHTNGLMNQILLPLSFGACITLVPFFEPKQFIEELCIHKPTYFTAVPTMLSRLLEHDVPSEAVENLRFIRSGAAPLLPETHKLVETHFDRNVIVSYGQTETTCTNTGNPPSARKIGSVGKVLDGRDVAILNANSSEPVPTGQSGEVCFRGKCIAIGMVGEKPFNQEDWFRTGDIGYLDDYGYLFLTGRSKDIIIRGGANLSPRQIEDAILSHDCVAEVAVLGIPDDDLGEVPVACIVPKGTNPVLISDTNSTISTRLSAAHRLQAIYEFDTLPQNAIGKIDTKALRATISQLQKSREKAGLLVPCEDLGPLEYIKRTRHYYQALGFGTPYEWAENTDIPLAKLKKPLNQASIAIVTTAALFNPEAGPQGPGAPYNAKAKFYDVYSADICPAPDLRISHIAIDRDNTSAEDINAYFPLKALMLAEKTGRIGRVAKQFYGLPTNRSKRVTTSIDAQKLLQLCEKQKVDAVIFVPNCPVCHQSVTLVSRVLEEAGIPTVIMGAAKDIVQSAGAPRFVFNDFPLGNSAGRPFDVESQKIVLNTALDLLENATTPGAIIQTPLQWIGRKDWKSYYSNPDRLSKEEIAERKAKFDADKAAAKSIRTRSAR